MDDTSNNGARDPQQKPADEGREPKFVDTQPGMKRFSVGALLERVIAHFVEEYPDHSPALMAVETTAKKVALVRDVTEYVLAVESVVLGREEKADLISRAYAELFSYGPLDALLLDDRVTTISLDGANKAAVRYGHGDLTPLGPIFEDEGHLRRVLRRIAVDAGAELRADLPYMELGLTAGERPICVNLVTPLLSFQYTADIRVHPAVPVSLDDLVAQDFMNEQAAILLKAIVQSPHGFVIAGDTESGKTTLLNALLALLPNPEGIVCVERAGELRLPEGTKRLRAVWPVGDQTTITFGGQIEPALALNPTCLVLDEVRNDEPETIAPLLSNPDMPRQIWTFRSSPDAKRLRNALGMVARRANPQQAEALAIALYTRLPFVITVRSNRTAGRLMLHSVAEWQPGADPQYPDYVTLLERDSDQLRFTGKMPSHHLKLPQTFWR